jgi:TPR repeat protein
MPNSNEEPLPPAGEAAPAPVSTPADSVAEVNDQLASTKLSDQDEAKPPANAEAGDTGDTNTKEDPDLWKPHPPTEECPVCMVPLSLKSDTSIYWSCCGKMLCLACDEEHLRALRVTNRKRDKKKLQPLGLTCAFCRSPLYKNDAELMSRFEKRIEKGDARAMLNLGKMFRDGSDVLRKDDVKAFELFHRAAGLGCAEAVGQLGYWAVHKTLTPDRTKARKYLEEAAAKGDLASRGNLGHLLAGEGEIELAIKHWHLSAAAGCDHAMKLLWKCFSKGTLSKPDLEKTLRAHKASSDEMNSEERERLDAAVEARAGNDELLIRIYGSYYLGYINAKELKKALKGHRAGDRTAVETFLAMKIRADS